MLFRMYARSFFSTASRARRSDLGNLLPTVKHKKAMPRTKRSPSITGANRFINRSSEEASPLYLETTDLCREHLGNGLVALPDIGFGPIPLLCFSWIAMRPMRRVSTTLRQVLTKFSEFFNGADYGAPHSSDRSSAF